MNRKNQLILLFIIKKKISLYSYEYLSMRIRFRMKRNLNNEFALIQFYRKSKTFAWSFHKKIYEFDEFWIWWTYHLLKWTCNKSNEHAICLTNSQWITNMQWIRNWTKNHFIILFTFYRKMINKYWKYIRMYLKNDFIKFFISFIFIVEIKQKNIYLSFDQKSFDENSQSV